MSFVSLPVSLSLAPSALVESGSLGEIGCDRVAGSKTNEPLPSFSEVVDSSSSADSVFRCSLSESSRSSSEVSTSNPNFSSEGRNGSCLEEKRYHSLLSYAYGKSSEVGSVTRFYDIFLLLKSDRQPRSDKVSLIYLLTGSNAV